MKCGGLISSLCPRNPHKKVGNEKRRQRISGQADKASATKMVDLGSIPGRVKLKTIMIGIHSFPT